MTLALAYYLLDLSNCGYYLSIVQWSVTGRKVERAMRPS